MHLTRRLATQLLSSLLTASAMWASAAAAPQNVTIIVPGGAGGTPDVIARQVAEAITKHTGKTVVVENKIGAGGSIGGRIVTQANPDGATLLITSSGITGTAGHMYANYHPIEKLDHFAMLVEVPFVVVARNNFPTNSPQEFLDYVRKNPGKVRWSNAGVGTHGHLTQVMIERAGNIDLDIIPYKGSVPAFNDLLGGHVDAAMDNVAMYRQSIEAGRVKPVFVTSKQRLPTLPNVPTARELGVPLDNLAWYALAAPKGTPKAVYDEIHVALLKYFDTTANRAQYAAQGMNLILSSPADTQKRAVVDSANFGRLIKELNLSAE